MLNEYTITIIFTTVLTVHFLTMLTVFITVLLLFTYRLYVQDMDLKNICKTTINIHKNSPCQKWYKTGEIGKKIET